MKSSYNLSLDRDEFGILYVVLKKAAEGDPRFLPLLRKLETVLYDFMSIEEVEKLEIETRGM